jgi:glycosyltransferase involved in cell wall biosynthesis
MDNSPHKLRSDAPRILQICHSYTGPFLDCARQYAVLFDGSPYEVTTVYLTGMPSEEVRKGSASAEVIFLGYESIDVRGLKLGAIYDLRRIVARGDYRLCIAHRFKPVYVALLSTKLQVIGVHHAFSDYQRWGRRLLARFFYRRLSLLGVSNAVRDDLRTCLTGWPAERIATLYNRINVEEVSSEQVDRESARIALGLPKSAWIVGNAGRLHPDKDQTTLIRAFAAARSELPADSLLAIMGSGRLESSLKQLAADLGVADQVRFLGQIPAGRRYFKAFDLFALASNHEPFGMVLLEAMAAGVPLICSDCGGGREVVAGVGEVFPLGDSQALARQMLLAAATPFNTLKVQQAAMSRRVREVFSDETARGCFWALPMVAPLVGRV